MKSERITDLFFDVRPIYILRVDIKGTIEIINRKERRNYSYFFNLGKIGGRYHRGHEFLSSNR